MIIAVYSSWNEQNRIGASIASIHDYVDMVVVIDGRYEGFMEQCPVESTDLTKEIATSFSKVEFIQLHEAMRPCYKRGLMFSIPSDWYLIMDPDEIMYGPAMNDIFAKLESGELIGKGFNVKTYFDLNRRFRNIPGYFTRFIHKSAGFHYGTNHWDRLDKDGNSMDIICKNLDGIEVIQMNELCGSKRTQAKSAWVTWRQGQGEEGW